MVGHHRHRHLKEDNGIAPGLHRLTIARKILNSRRTGGRADGGMDRRTDGRTGRRSLSTKSRLGQRFTFCCACAVECICVDARVLQDADREDHFRSTISSMTFLPLLTPLCSPCPARYRREDASRLSTLRAMASLFLTSLVNGRSEGKGRNDSGPRVGSGIVLSAVSFFIHRHDTNTAL